MKDPIPVLAMVAVTVLHFIDLAPYCHSFLRRIFSAFTTLGSVKATIVNYERYCLNRSYKLHKRVIH